MKLLSSLVGVALSLSVSIENSQKLYEVQKSKTMRQKSTLQLDRIQKTITEVRQVSLWLCREQVSVNESCPTRFLMFFKLQEKRAEIESMMDIVFKGVFLKRYRLVFQHCFGTAFNVQQSVS